jgi:hypothetical protein
MAPPWSEQPGDYGDRGGGALRAPLSAKRCPRFSWRYEARSLLLVGAPGLADRRIQADHPDSAASFLGRAAAVGGLTGGRHAQTGSRAAAHSGALPGNGLTVSRSSRWMAPVRPTLNCGNAYFAGLAPIGYWGSGRSDSSHDAELGGDILRVARRSLAQSIGGPG